MPSWPGAWATLQDRPFSAAASVYRSTSEEKHGRLLKRGSLETAGRCQSPMTSEEWQWILPLKQLKAPEERQGRLHEDPSLQCQWTAEDLERHGRLSRHYWLHLQNQSDVWGSIMNHDWIPPCSRESHPRSAMPTFSSPPPPPPCTNLTFTELSLSLQS